MAKECSETLVYASQNWEVISIDGTDIGQFHDCSSWAVIPFVAKGILCRDTQNWQKGNFMLSNLFL